MLTASAEGFRDTAAVFWRRVAICAWAAILVGSCARCLVGRSEQESGVFAIYAAAGQHWLSGADLYPPKDSWNSFLYSPAIAVGLVPYSILSSPLGAIFWRLTLGGVYLLALRWWSRALLPASLTPTQQALIYLLILPVTAMTLLDGQAGALVAASVLLTMAAAAEERWMLAAAFAIFGVLLKVYPIALVLLMMATFPRRVGLWVVLALLAGLALPFLFQRPGYVADQYAKWVAMLLSSDRQEWTADIANRDVALLFRASGIPLEQHVWLAIRLGAAAGAAVLCVAARRAGWPRRSLLLLLQALACLWMTLFGPVVESFTYILVGPTLAWLLIDAWRLQRPRAYRSTLVASWLIFTSATLAVVVMHSIKYHRLGPHPLAGLLLLAGVGVDAAWRFGKRTAIAPANAVSPQAA